MRINEQEQLIIDKLAERALQHFDSSLDLAQNMTMATLSTINTVTEGARATNLLAAAIGVTAPELDYSLTGVHTGLMLSAHCPSLASAILEALSTSHRLPGAITIEAILERLWELAR